MFKITYQSDGTVSLLANTPSGRYVTTNGSATHPLVADRTMVGDWEEFFMTS